MNKIAGVEFPTPILSSNSNGRFLPRALAVVLDITAKQAASGLHDGKLGQDRYLAIHEFVHFWQFACSTYGLIRTEIEALEQQLITIEMLQQGRQFGSISLPLNFTETNSADIPSAAEFRARSDAWHGSNVSVVSPSSDRRANMVVPGSELEPPTWYLPLEDSVDLLRVPIGTLTLLESAAEVIGRAHLPSKQKIERQIALMPFSRSAFPHSSSYWHYSGAHAYFSTLLMAKHQMSVHERDGLFLDVVDLALLIPGTNGVADLVSPGHRFINLTRATINILKTKSNLSRSELIHRIHDEAGYGGYIEVCSDILERKRALFESVSGVPYPNLGPVFGQLYAYFEVAMQMRMNAPHAFGSALLESGGVEKLLATLPPAIIFYRDDWWHAPRWWVHQDGGKQFLKSGRGKDPALSNLFLSSIVQQAMSQDYVQCPLRSYNVGTPCGCDVERMGLPTFVPATHPAHVYCHFLDIWKKLESGNI